ncbi:DUF6082 family protein [Streptomyces sp. NPDC048442]|uniref:DUF6082 family protein n=1 Tax=Streptomyces sp. NPDC048442 TaxID=3154823 RepID=UPI003447DD55
MGRLGVWKEALQQHLTSQRYFKTLKLLTLSMGGLALVAAGSVFISGWLIDGVEAANGNQQTATDRSSLGDYFGGVSALFSGTALLMLVITLVYQQRELRLQRQELTLQRAELVASRNELRRSADSDLRGHHVQLTQLQLENPELMAVWNDYPGVPETQARQHLFANLTFSHYLLMLKWGSISDAEIIAHADRLLQSPTFRAYWDASSAAKEKLPRGTDEYHLFNLFNLAMTRTDRETGGASPRRHPD